MIVRLKWKTLQSGLLRKGRGEKDDKKFKNVKTEKLQRQSRQGVLLVTSDATCSKFHPRRLLLFLSSYQVADEQAIAASKVAMKTPYHPHSISSMFFFSRLVLNDNVYIWFNTNIYGRVLNKKWEML